MRGFFYDHRKYKEIVIPSDTKRSEVLYRGRQVNYANLFLNHKRHKEHKEISQQKYKEQSIKYKETVIPSGTERSEVLYRGRQWDLYKPTMAEMLKQVQHDGYFMIELKEIFIPNHIK